jgi:hypothetical protein
MWFCIEALFSFHSNAPMIFFPGGAVLVWFLIFMIQKIGNPFSRLDSDNHATAGGWLVMLILCYAFVSWTQVRLTAASASPDFIASIFILATISCFLKSNYSSDHNKIYFYISAIVAAAAIQIKLSAIGIIILPLFILFQFVYRKNWREFFTILILLLLFISPLLARNYISSGWYIFPSHYFDFFHPDWQFDKNELIHFQHYINAYARFPVSYENAERVVSLPLAEWIIPWWKHLSGADQVMLIILFVALLLNFIFIRNFMAKASVNLRVATITMMFSLVIWFLNAPDPRFASGSILSLIYCLVIPWQSVLDSFNRIQARRLLAIVIYVFLAGILSYSAYRVLRFFDSKEIVFPMGISKTEYRIISCGNLKFYEVNGNVDNCGSTPLPCVRDNCISVEPRGDRPEDGFRKKEMK